MKLADVLNLYPDKIRHKRWGPGVHVELDKLDHEFKTYRETCRRVYPSASETPGCHPLTLANLYAETDDWEIFDPAPSVQAGHHAVIPGIPDSWSPERVDRPQAPRSFFDAVMAAVNAGVSVEIRPDRAAPHGMSIGYILRVERRSDRMKWERECAFSMASLNDSAWGPEALIVTYLDRDVIRLNKSANGPTNGLTPAPSDG